MTVRCVSLIACIFPTDFFGNFCIFLSAFPPFLAFTGFLPLYTARRSTNLEVLFSINGAISAVCAGQLQVYFPEWLNWLGKVFTECDNPQAWWFNDNGSSVLKMHLVVSLRITSQLNSCSPHRIELSSVDKWLRPECVCGTSLSHQAIISERLRNWFVPLLRTQSWYSISSHDDQSGNSRRLYSLDCL